jgi:hypothetical protein
VTNTDINKLLEIVVKVGQVILSPFVICNEFLLSLEKLLPLLLKPFTLGSFVVDACHHQGVLVVILMLGVLC